MYSFPPRFFNFEAQLQLTLFSLSKVSTVFLSFSTLKSGSVGSNSCSWKMYWFVGPPTVAMKCDVFLGFRICVALVEFKICSPLFSFNFVFIVNQKAESCRGQSLKLFQFNYCTVFQYSIYAFAQLHVGSKFTQTPDSIENEHRQHDRK